MRYNEETGLGGTAHCSRVLPWIIQEMDFIPARASAESGPVPRTAALQGFLRHMPASNIAFLRRLIVIAVISAAVLVQWRLIDTRDDGETIAVQPPALSTPAPQLPQGPLSGRNIGLVIGHWSRDTGPDQGALCLDAAGEVFLTELAVNYQVAMQLAPRLEDLGAQVWLLEERDRRLQGLFADLALSLHADSCIEASGYKAAALPTSAVREEAGKFIVCIQQEYEAHTGLEWHAFSITNDMIHYHMHGKVHNRTPSVILEMGFMGGDQVLLTERQDLIVEGILNSILCFLDPEEPSPPA